MELRKSRNVSRGEILKLHSQGAFSCHQSKERHVRETKRRARNCEKRKGAQSLDASSESVQMFRADSGLGSAASLHSHRK